MLSTSELRLLSEIGKSPPQATSLNEIADRLEWSVSHTSRVVTQLEDRELVRSGREDGRKTVTPMNVQPVEQLSNLVSEYPHVDFPNLINGSALRLLYYLDGTRTATELEELSGVSRATVYRRLETLQHVGIVGQDHSRYALTDAFTSLAELARSLAHHDHRLEATRVATDVQIIWETLDEYLFGCRSELKGDDFYLTGPAAFQNYGIPLLTRERTHYFRSGRHSEATPADLVCHMLLIEDSTRYRTYCLLLITGQEITEPAIEEQAAHYDREIGFELREVIRELFAYLKTEGDVTSESLPEWEDFKATAADYDISV